MTEWELCDLASITEDAAKVELASPVTVKEGRMTDGPWDPADQVDGRVLMICLQGRWVGFPSRGDAYRWLASVFQQLALQVSLETKDKDPEKSVHIDYSIERIRERRYQLIDKGKRTEEDEAELVSLDRIMDFLPSNPNPSDINAMRIIHEFAEVVKSKRTTGIKIQAKDMFLHPNFKLPVAPDVRDTIAAQEVVEWTARAVAAFISPVKVDGESKEIECGDLADTIRTRVAERLKAEIRGGKGG